MHKLSLRASWAHIKKLHPFALPAFGMILAVLVAGASLRLAANTNASPEKQSAALIEAVGNLIVLPEGESPTIATVTDPDALKGMPLFARAEAGDAVLIYAQSGKAILYSPAKKRIVDVMPIDTATRNQ